MHDSRQRSTTASSTSTGASLSSPRFHAPLSDRSEAVRSDTATVNSGSEMEDFEVESIRSRDSSAIRTTAGAGTVAAALSRAVNSVPAFTVAAAPATSKTTTDQESDNLDCPGSSSSAAPAAAPEPSGGEAITTLLTMAPPVSQLEAAATATRSGGSPEESSTASEDKKPQAQPPGEAVSTALSTATTTRRRPLTASTSPGLSNAAHESQSEQQQQQSRESKMDEESSLDVEVNSTGNATFSYDEQTHASSDDSHTSRGGVLVDDIGDAAAIGEPAASSFSGRLSPGGTIYIGRGSRQYQGRYINVALRRYHQGGVHPDAIQGSDDTDGEANQDTDEHKANTEHIYDERQRVRSHQRSRRREQSTRRDENRRSRSRSRSRSPE